MMKKMGRTATQNFAQLLNSYDPFVQTSVVNQNTTTYTIEGSGIISNARGLVRSAFSMIVTCMLYVGKKGRGISCSDFSPAQPDGTPAQRRRYTELFQMRFDGFQMAGFILNGVGPVDGNLDIILSHAPCKRRIVFCDQFVNLDNNSGDPTDRSALNTSGMGDGENITTGAINVNDPFEVLYGVVGIGGSFNRFTGPQTYIPIQSQGTKVDNFDCSLKTYYKLTSSTGAYPLVATAADKDLSWGAALFGFKTRDLN